MPLASTMPVAPLTTVAILPRPPADSVCGGYLAAAASRFSLWWHGDRRPPALTADTASGAGLQGGIEDDVPPSNGGAATAPSEGGDSRTDSDLECSGPYSPGLDPSFGSV